MPDPTPRLNKLRTHVEKTKVFGASEALELIDILLNKAPASTPPTPPTTGSVVGSDGPLEPSTPA